MQTMKKDRIYRKMPGSAGTAFRKYGRPLFVFAAAILAAGCFRDLGNYDYTEINEAVIGDSGFSSPYNIRINETLSIRPDITFTLDPDGTEDYTYEWVAVGQTLYRGERFTIGTGRDLDYVMKLDADNYILYLKVTDNATGIVYSKDVELNVMSPYSTGWMMAGEAGGKGQVDMMSISGDVIFYTGAVTMEDGISLGPIECIWVDNDTYTSDDRVYIGTASGSYKLDRSSFSGSAAGDIKYSFAIDPGEDTYSLTDSEQVRTDTAPHRHSVIIKVKVPEFREVHAVTFPGKFLSLFPPYHVIVSEPLTGKFYASFPTDLEYYTGILTCNTFIHVFKVFIRIIVGCLHVDAGHPDPVSDFLDGSVQVCLSQRTEFGLGLRKVQVHLGGTEYRQVVA